MQNSAIILYESKNFMSKSNKGTKKTKSPFSIKLGQFIYLSFSCFNQNGLWESASSCSYGFICSFIPILLIITSIVFSVIRVSPVAIQHFQDFLNNLSPMLDFSSIVQINLLSKHQFSAVDILLIFWVIWIARKLNLSIVLAMKRIFGSQTKKKNWWIQAVTLISEFAFIILVALLILATFILRKLLHQPIFEQIIQKWPFLSRTSSNVIATIVMYFILFICTLMAYKFLSGVFPSFKTCFICSFLNTVTFYGLVKLFDSLINRSNYNFVYGTISSIIIMIVKVYFFFVLFLFFAQTIYVTKFFDQLLKSQIYFLPKDLDAGLGQSFIRMLFINPSILQNEDNTIYYEAGQKIFNKGEEVNAVLYLHKGIISETHSDGSVSYIERGNLIGETQCIINGFYQGSAIALTKCEIVSFSEEEFMQIIQKDARVAKQAINRVNEFTKIHKYPKEISDQKDLTRKVPDDDEIEDNVEDEEV